MKTQQAIAQRKAFLQREKIGVCDIVGAAYRDKIDASDLGMQRVELRDLLGILGHYPKVTTLIFTRNSKMPWVFFRQLLKAKLTLVCLVDQARENTNWNGLGVITTYSLTAPSGTANRAIGSGVDAIKTRRKTLNIYYGFSGRGVAVGFFLTNRRNEITNLIDAFFF